MQYIKQATPHHDYSLSITFESGSAMKYSMSQFLHQLRFAPLRDFKVWLHLEVFPTRLEWNKGAHQVTLNIEELIPHQDKK